MRRRCACAKVSCFIVANEQKHETFQSRHTIRIYYIIPKNYIKYSCNKLLTIILQNIAGTLLICDSVDTVNTEQCVEHCSVLSGMPNALVYVLRILKFCRNVGSLRKTKMPNEILLRQSTKVY